MRSATNYRNTINPQHHKHDNFNEYHHAHNNNDDNGRTDNHNDEHEYDDLACATHHRNRECVAPPVRW